MTDSREAVVLKEVVTQWWELKETIQSYEARSFKDGHAHIKLTYRELEALIEVGGLGFGETEADTPALTKKERAAYRRAVQKLIKENNK